VGTPPAADVTRLLLAWRQGDEAALDRLLPLVYSELRVIAHARMRAEAPGDQTLQTTELVNEAFVRLVDGARVAWNDRVHFYAVCARLMRRILIDRARAQLSLKRGGDERPLPIAERDGAVPARAADDVLALDEALRRLSTADPRKGQVVEMGYFAGLSVEETAEALGVSVETVMRDWKVAKTWLLRDLRLGDRDGGRGTRAADDRRPSAARVARLRGDARARGRGARGLPRDRVWRRCGPAARGGGAARRAVCRLPQPPRHATVAAARARGRARRCHSCDPGRAPGWQELPPVAPSGRERQQDERVRAAFRLQADDV
jgi:RNA polymerase sigma-70 factor, ECF subfamily